MYVSSLLSLSGECDFRIGRMGFSSLEDPLSEFSCNLFLRWYLLDLSPITILLCVRARFAED